MVNQFMNFENESKKLILAWYQPRITQNTGNIARTCAAFNLPLHLIEPLGFSLTDKYLKRAGLDYWQFLSIYVHPNYESFIKSLRNKTRIVGFSKSGNLMLQDVKFMFGDVLLFGREDNGLPETIQMSCDFPTAIPMPGGVVKNKIGVRSLTLSVASAIAAYQASIKLKLV